jgi:hypothetical protein
VQCFYYTDGGIFLEHMRSDSLETYGYISISIDQVNRWMSFRAYPTQSHVRPHNLAGYPCG